MELRTEDRIAIHELLALHGHLVDDGDLDSLDLLLTDDVVYDVSALGSEPLVGRQAFRDAALGLGDRNPVGHHVTNVVVTATGDGVASVRSKGIGVRADGGVGSVVYDDEVTRTPTGWRIRRRTVRPRRVPLQR